MRYRILQDINTFYVENGYAKCEKLHKGQEIEVEKAKIINNAVVCFYGNKHFTAETSKTKYAERLDNRRKPKKGV